MAGDSYLILGGAGLVGLQIARRIAHDLFGPLEAAYRRCRWCPKTARPPR